MADPGLPPSLYRVLRTEPVDGVVDPASIRQARRGRIDQMLLRGVEAGDAVIEHRALRRLHAQRLQLEAHRLSLVAATRELVDRAATHDVELVMVKGLANSYLLYDSPLERRASDVDVLLPRGVALGPLLIDLGVEPVRVDAIDRLIADERAAHEVTIPATCGGVNLDLHANPYGLITAFHGAAISPISRRLDIDDGLVVQGPATALALVVAAVNLVRRGGAALWHAADIVRLLRGVAGPIDWELVGRLCRADGLDRIVAAGVWAVVDDLDLAGEVETPLRRPNRRARWAPRLGEAPTGWSRRMTLVPLYRPPGFLAESVGALVRWYLPNRRLRVATARTDPVVRVLSERYSRRRRARSRR